MTYMLLLNCAIKLVEEIVLYYDARSKKHQSTLRHIMSHYITVASAHYLCKQTVDTPYSA